MNLRARSSQGRFRQSPIQETVDKAEETKVVSRHRASASQLSTIQGASSNLIAVWSVLGSQGRSTISASLAYLLGQSREVGEVLLVDADGKAPAQHTLHGLTDVTAGVLAAGRLARLDRYSNEEHDRLTIPANGYRLLTGIQSIERWSELDDHACNRLLTALRQTANNLVFDISDEIDSEPIEPALGIRRNQLALSVIRHAGVVVLVCGADPIALSRLPEAFGQLELGLVDDMEQRLPPRVVLAINRMRDAAIGSDAKNQIEEYLDSLACSFEFEVVFLPDDPKSCDSALKSGDVVAKAHPRSSFSRAVKAMAAQINSTHVNTSRARKTKQQS